MTSLGRRLGPIPSKNYSRARALGDGSYGSVTVGYDDESGAEVALKLFDPSEDGSATTEALREISALRILMNTPSIVPLLDVVFDLSGVAVLGIVLPLYPWSTADAIDANGFRGAPAMLKYAAQLLEALSYMHSCQPALIHRDIKPENVMLDESMSPVLIDFSFCKFIEDESATATTATTATPPKKSRARKKKKTVEEKSKNTGNLGTPTYVAPELLACKPYDARVDVWSTGVLLLEVMQKKRLDTDRDKAALRIIAEKRNSLSKSLPAACVLHGMLDPEPSSRLTSAQALNGFKTTCPQGYFRETLPSPICLNDDSDPELVIVVRPNVKTLCKQLDFKSDKTAEAASRYLDVLGPFEATRKDADLYATLVAAKLYEQDALDSEEAAYELNRDVDTDEFIEFEENLLRLCGCCLFI